MLTFYFLPFFVDAPSMSSHINPEDTSCNLVVVFFDRNLYHKVGNVLNPKYTETVKFNGMRISAAKRVTDGLDSVLLYIYISSVSP